MAGPDYYATAITNHENIQKEQAIVDYFRIKISDLRSQSKINFRQACGAEFSFLISIKTQPETG
jgi:hypothetical protein